MKKNITYLFGAGASANAIPIVKHFNFRMKQFLLQLKKWDWEGEWQNKFTPFIRDVEFILEESKKHSTIDTVAKKFFHSYLNRKDDLGKLKKVVSAFLIYEQLTQEVYTEMRTLGTNDPLTDEETESIKSKKGNLDFRYDAFIASLLLPVSNALTFPDHVKILTWNYDSQFELVLKNFTASNCFWDVQANLGSYPRMFWNSDKEYWDNLSSSRFKILHLNGKANYYTMTKGVKRYESIFDKASSFSLPETILQVANYDESFSTLTFSWERNSNEKIQTTEVTEIVSEAIKIAHETEILVIIGYSFPFFNREVDRKLFHEGRFEKVYIQDYNAKNIKNLFLNIFEPRTHKDNVQEYTNIDQFVLPPELDSEYPEPFDTIQIN